MVSRYQPPLGSYLAFELCLKKMYITINDVVGKKTIDLAYLIQNLDSSMSMEGLLLVCLAPMFNTR